MEFVEKIAKTVDTAITDALIELGASRDEVEIEILEKGSKGLLGFGAKNAKVRVALKDDVIEKRKQDNEMLGSTSARTTKLVEQKPVVKEIIKKEENNNRVTDIAIKEIPEEDVHQVEEKALAFLKEMLEAMNVQGTVHIKETSTHRVYLEIEGEGMGMIIGKRGETLDSIQYLVNIVANRGRDKYIKVVLDTENYRQRREETLRKLAYKLSKKVYQTKRPITLEPMNPYDRRIIHAALQDSKTVKTHSEGKEPFRRVVIMPMYQNRSYK